MTRLIVVILNFLEYVGRVSESKRTREDLGQDSSSKFGVCCITLHACCFRISETKPDIHAGAVSELDERGLKCSPFAHTHADVWVYA
jgi:hypothetical protein